ncbi:MAG: YbaK/EbsC family protein [bacterium]|nr:YbaK/EbsC family protein [bacterium]
MDRPRVDPVVERVREQLAPHGLACRVRELPVDTATVPEAAAALGVEAGQIAKTLCFLGNQGAALVVAAGDARVNQSKLKAELGWTGKVRLAGPEETLRQTGFSPGGVCPFGVTVPVLLDQSLTRYPVVYPAAGSARSAVSLTPEELARVTGGRPCSVCDLKPT